MMNSVSAEASRRLFGSPARSEIKSRTMLIAIQVAGVLWSNYDRSFSRRYPADLDAGVIGGTGDPISYEQ